MKMGFMKITLLLGLILVAYLAWRFVVRGDALVLATAKPGKEVSAQLKRVVPEKEIVIEISVGTPNTRISEIDMSRVLAEELGVSPPPGFTVEELPLTEKEKSDKDTVEFAAKFNQETLRWVGDLAVAPGVPAEIVIPASRAAFLDGRVDLIYRRKSGFGGATGMLRVPLSAKAPDKAS